jgi:hypothetical protein
VRPIGRAFPAVTVTAPECFQVNTGISMIAEDSLIAGQGVVWVDQEA